MKFMIELDCKDTPLWNRIVEYRDNWHEPNFNLMYNLALKAFHEKDYERAGKFAGMALDDASNEEEKSLALELLKSIENAM